MKAIPTKFPKTLILGCNLTCADNSGARIVELIGVKGYKGRKRKLPQAGLCDIIICSVKKGKVAIRKQKVRAVIVRQKKEFRRPDGTRVRFNDNAAVIVTDDKLPKGSEIKGPIAKEVGIRYPKVAGIASTLI
ncbi:MAG: 50S ribosomal protein L14 [Candidatus Diapherotrites archaeon]|nr:50S ribosomal protein L14 [Candidatus Diapherotrites archaeon]